MATSILFGFGRRVTIEDVISVARGARVRVTPKTASILRARRAQVMDYVRKTKEPAYGFNRGFGHNVDLSVPVSELETLQRNIVRSHASGVGEPLSREVVRAAMFLRAQSLAQGASGVRPQVVEALVTFLNRDITPKVPSYGSVGASGDLAPLAHIALALMGEGEVLAKGSSRPQKAAQVLKRLRIPALKLEAKEGLALTNGVQVSTALAVLAQHELELLLRTAAIATSLSAQVMLGSDAPFENALQLLRPHPGAISVASWISKLMRKSPLRESHRHYEVDGEVQDPYNLRCAPQILGACHDLLRQSAETLSIEINSATDNPLILETRPGTKRYTRIVSGGHFHGMPIAIALYNHLQAMGIMARLSNMRCVRYVDEKRNKGLGSDLVWPGLSASERATSSGMMIPEYASAALTNALWGAAMPSHLFSLSTDAGQEDHVSMSATLGLRVVESLPRLAEVLAIELAFASQAAEIRRASDTIPTKHSLKPSIERSVAKAISSITSEIRRAHTHDRIEPQVTITLNRAWRRSERLLSPLCERINREVKKAFPPVKRDRELSTQLTKLAALVRSGKLVKLAGL